jgi:hypothetical protein
MRKLLIAACFGAALVPGIAWADYKKDYCGGVEYVGQDDGNKYPHLHCGKNFLTFSYAANSYKNLAQNSIVANKKCNATDDLLNNPPYDETNTTNPGGITATLQAFKVGGCN